MENLFGKVKNATKAIKSNFYKLIFVPKLSKQDEILIRTIFAFEEHCEDNKLKVAHAIQDSNVIILDTYKLLEK